MTIVPPSPEKPQSSTSKLLGKSVGVATTAAVVASTVVASKAATAFQGVSAVVAGSSSVVQAPTAIQSLGESVSHVDQASGITDVLPLDGEQVEFQGISDLFDQMGTEEGILPSSTDSLSMPDFDQPAIKGLRKFKE